MPIEVHGFSSSASWQLACDASYDMPDPAALARAGYTVVMGYLSHTAGKGMTAAYVAKCAAADIAILPLYETTSGMALGGRSAGVTAATTATSIARSLGCPADVPIIYALDQDYSSRQMAGSVLQFVNGLHSVAGPDGEYGGYDQLKYLVSHKVDVGRLFQSYAWSGGRWLPSSAAPIEQYHNGVHLAGGTVDLCRIDTSHLTLWEPGMPTQAQIQSAIEAGVKAAVTSAAMKAAITAAVKAEIPAIADAVAAELLGDDAIANPSQRPDSPTHVPAGTNPAARVGFALGDIWQRTYDLLDDVAALSAKVSPPPTGPTS